MATHESTIEVDRPVRTVYDQWTQFEDFPQFMEGVERVEQRSDTDLHWVANIAGARREWDARITEQEPDRRIAWQSTSGSRNAGVVSFVPVNESRTQITLRLDFEPEGITEKAGEMLGVIKGRVEGDLSRFRSFVEDQGYATGAWRGEVHGGTVTNREGRDSASSAVHDGPGTTDPVQHRPAERY